MLFELSSDLLEIPFALEKLDPDNELSMRYVRAGSQNISVASTGTRLLVTLLGICMDDRFNTLLIDEPELGLSPRIQQRLGALLQDKERRAAAFPHLSNVIVATHSHLFLDQSDFRNNFVVAKEDERITLSGVESMNDYHRLQFNLLGNTLESLFLPSGIVVVEGKSDFEFLDRLLQLHFPDRRLTVISSQGDPKRRIADLRDAFGGDLMRSPFKGRIFVVLDSVHQPGLSAELVGMGVDAPNVVTWDQNGIEHLYPEQILRELFAGEASVSIDDDRVEANGIVITKAKLASEVVKRLNSGTAVRDEMMSKLIEPIRRAIE